MRISKWSIFVLTLIISLSYTKDKNSPSKEEYSNENMRMPKKRQLVVQLCMSWSYRKFFEDMREFIEKHFKDVEVIGEQYPLSQTRRILSFSVLAVQVLFIIFLVTGINIKPYLPKIVSSFYDSLQENKAVLGIMVFVVGNMLQSQISNTGALEVYLDGELIWSKIQTGQPIDMKFLVNILKRKN